MHIDCQWSLAGAAQPADFAIIVDILSFSTSVSIAAERGAQVFPLGPDDDAGDALAGLVGARAAGRKRDPGSLSLSPASLMNLQPGDAIVLRSPNGARCSLAAAAPHVFCGSLRNASAIARSAAEAGGKIMLVPAGEVWPDGSLRVAFEDQAGAGAIISALSALDPAAVLTPEARAARAVFEEAKRDLLARLLACPSGEELTARGFARDVELAAQLDASSVAPMLMMHRQRYRAIAPDSPIAGHRIRYFENACEA
jgi:2-phosphosulfolactate phosphatase